MRKSSAFSTVDWRKYLDVNVNPRAKTFLESRGNDVLWQISSEINRANVRGDHNELVMLVHPHAGAVIKIERKDFGELLNISLNWFKNNEKYEICGKISKFIKRNSKQKEHRTLKNIKETIL